MLHELLTTHHDELVERARAQLVSRSAPSIETEEIEHGVPVFLAQIADELRLLARTSSPEIGRLARAHGRALLREGFTISQVVHVYGDVCQSITELAGELNAPITNEEFHTLNRCFDDAIAEAVSEFSGEKEAAIARTSTERLGFLAHELRNLVTTATVSFDLLRKGTVGVGGSTGAVHERALQGLRNIVARALSEVRLEAGIDHRERLPLRRFMDDLEATASLEAAALGHHLTVVGPDDKELAVHADPHILASVLSNLLQNAFKFSHAQSTVILRTTATADTVSIEVEDECGGLSPAQTEAMFRPFARRNTDRSGLGLGLSICREGARANGGVLRVRDVPAHGCVFTVELPRAHDADRGKEGQPASS